MYLKILMVALLVFVAAGCKRQLKTAVQEHEEPKFQYTAYSNNFELFAEADPFVIGETGNVLSHFSELTEFRAVEQGKIKITLNVGDKTVEQTLEQPTRKGIYSFDIKPTIAGKGTLKFDITNKNGKFEVIVPEVFVFASQEEAHKAAEKIVISRTNTTVFTKEQSWKIDFSTAFPQTESFGQIIKATALIQSTQGDEVIVSAKTNGIVKLASNSILEGKDVSGGQLLFSISGNDLSENNLYVRYSEAKNNYEKAKSDYERVSELAVDKIISEKELQVAKNQYDNAKTIFDNLNKNFNASGQSVISPMSGFIKQVFVKNGTYVEAGQPVVTISQNKTLILCADVPQKYAPVLATIKSANIRTLTDNKTYTLEQLNGKILSYGKSANIDNYLIPVNLQLDNKGSFTPGGFVEVFLKTTTNAQALTVPNASLLEEQGVYYVYVQVNPELFEKREVSIGKTDGLRTEIVKGLSEKERIVAKGAIIVKLAQATGTLDAHSGHVH